MLSAVSGPEIYFTLKTAKACSYETSIYVSRHGITPYKTICIIILLLTNTNKKRIEVVQDMIQCWPIVKAIMNVKKSCSFIRVTVDVRCMI